MPTQTREILAASRLENVRYAIRDLACVADEVTKQGHKVLPLNIGDPNVFDFKPPPTWSRPCTRPCAITRTDTRPRRA